MHGLSAIDGDREIDWGYTSEDYANYRSDYPRSFYDRLHALGIGCAGQRVLDLGTGTGFFARAFAKKGSNVLGVDLSQRQIEQARKLCINDELEVEFQVGAVEDLSLEEYSFDVISAGQSWLYFDKTRIIPLVKRLLKPGGNLMTGHYCWLPRLDPIARASEELILCYNPQWSSSDYSGEIPHQPGWSQEDFNVCAFFYYDEEISFTRESWMGRIRACRGVGATLSHEEVKAFNLDHEKLLKKIAPETFSILHRLDAHIYTEKPWQK